MNIKNHPLKKTILHIEDDPDERTILCRLLRPVYKYVGREQAEQAEGLVERSDVHFIILDLSLPLMNGFEFLKKKAELLKKKKIPVILTTGVEGSNIKALSREHSCYAVFQKPYNPKAVLELLDRYFSSQIPDA